MSEIELIKDKLRMPYPLATIEWKIYVAIILLFASGLSLSFSLCDWQFFERFGSLIVILGIVVAWRDLIGKFDRVENRINSSLANDMENLKNESVGLVTKARNISIEDEINSNTNDIKEMFNLLRNRLRTIEAVTLIIGTFIWGFGSVIGGMFYSFNT